MKKAQIKSKLIDLLSEQAAHQQDINEHEALGLDDTIEISFKRASVSVLELSIQLWLVPLRMTKEEFINSLTGHSE